jgi:beta-lactamase class A
MKRGEGQKVHQKVKAVIGGLAIWSLAACATVPRADPRPPIKSPPAKPAPKPTPKPKPGPIVSNSQTAPAALVAGIRSLWAAYPDRAGIAVVRAHAPWSISHRGDEAMPQQSVSKLWVALTFLQGVDDGRWSLDDPVTVRKSDVTVFSAAMAARVGETGYATTFRTLLELSLTKSDNSANAVLLSKAGGPSAVRTMLAAKGLSGIKFGPGEHLLQAGTAGLEWKEEYREGRKFQAARALLSDNARKSAMDSYTATPPDGASPLAIARALLRLNKGELLSASGTRLMLGLMQRSETGKQRLRAGVPITWTYGHKTGTGQDFKGRTAGYNDVSLMTAPDGTTYAVVVQIADTTRPVPDRQALMQGISALVTANHQR